MHSREGVTQWDPISMVAYGIGVIPLIKRLKSVFPDVAYPWYADDAGAIGGFNNIGSYFNALNFFVLGRGYYPKPSKRILIVHMNNFAAGK